MAWCEFVGSFGGTPAAVSTSGRAGNSLRSTITVHFGIFRRHSKLFAVRTISCRVSASTGLLAMQWVSTLFIYLLITVFNILLFNVLFNISSVVDGVCAVD